MRRTGEVIASKPYIACGDDTRVLTDERKNLGSDCLEKGCNIR